MKDRILLLLESVYDALDFESICFKLNYTSESEKDAVRSALRELEDELVVYFTKKNKYILYSKCPNFKKGRIQINKSGNGFLVLEGEQDIFVPKEALGTALDGDTVLVEILDFDAKKPAGKVIKILKRDLNNIVGQINYNGVELEFVPYEKKNVKLIIDAETLKNCVDGEIVVVQIDEETKNGEFLSHVAKHVCHKDDAGADILTMIARYDIYPEFSDAAIDQANSLPNEISGDLLDEELEGRVDLRDKNIFTIDGSDTKDIDDAICVEMEDGYYILYVCIADVSHYVTEGSPLDLDAYQRGTSSYNANSVIPMLPHKLSNGICSLNPNETRCALTCQMKIAPNGKVVDYQIYPSIIESKKKMNYKSVNAVIEDNEIPEGYENFAETLKTMNELAHIIRRERESRGASDFDIDEPKIICDENGKAIDVIRRERGEGERLIEDFMIVANETVAKNFALMELPSIYRVHDVPKPEKIQSFISFCELTNHHIIGKFDKVNPKTFQKLLDQVNAQGDEDGIYKSLAVRSMPKAYYSKDNIGHFGLASIYYTHFTSPIRRYPDLIVHRLIRKYLVEGQINERTINYWDANLDAIAKQCSDRENAAVNAERDVNKMKFAEYMEQHIGETFEAVITGVTKNGIFVQLSNLVEGMVPVESIGGDYFDLIEERQAFVGRGTKKTYAIGDKLEVVCVSSIKSCEDPKDNKINFEIVKELRLANDGTEDKKVKKKELKHDKKRRH